MAEDKKATYDVQWEQNWRKLGKQNIIKICTKFFPRPPGSEKCNSIKRCLVVLNENGCYVNDAIAAWMVAGGHRKDILWSLESMRVPSRGEVVIPELKLRLRR